MDTLPDYVDHGLKALSIGLNPSSISVEKGFYFANPRNRFWRALDASGLVPEKVVPGVPFQERLFQLHRIGFTDVVKRPSPSAKALRAADYREWAPELEKKILGYAPGICWFHGKMAAKNFFRYTGHTDVVLEWGMQSVIIRHSAVFVSPNPSPANAAFSLQDITGWYRELATILHDMEHA
ncbi:MAG: mismatch-specific DNA-glycosylase [Gammaproteobacteria bacterium]|nr:mismatch-specific DNA-glycosylase [Gammaproteobacteria bacterium]